MTNPYKGIYYISGEVLFATQIVVGKELDQESHIWIKALSDRMQKQEMKELLEKTGALTHKFDRELADSVLEISIKANKQIVEELRGEDNMCKALLEIMEPEINEIVDAATKAAVEKATRETARGAAKRMIRKGKVTVEEIAAASVNAHRQTVEKYMKNKKERL